MLLMKLSDNHKSGKAGGMMVYFTLRWVNFIEYNLSVHVGHTSFVDPRLCVCVCVWDCVFH